MLCQYLGSHHDVVPGKVVVIGILIQDSNVSGSLLVCDEGLSFWGGVHPETGVIVDTHHPQHGESVAGKFVMMRSSRGSCTGSAVLLGLALSGKAPAAIIFSESEDVLTLGALVANSMYGSAIAVARLEEKVYANLSLESTASLINGKLTAGDLAIDLTLLDTRNLILSEHDESMRDGSKGLALQIAMETICILGRAQGAVSLLDISRAHIDGCIYASPANLTFAQTVMNMGGMVSVPTTMNAISVDYANWHKQGIDPEFGNAASQLADAYIAMGAVPSFTCAPYLDEDRPTQGESIGWAESNAVVYANSVLGARTNKHPDFFDLFIAMTGRVPDVGVYRESDRRPVVSIDVDLPAGADESVWPLLGWIAGHLARDRIPLLRGLADCHPDDDDLKALCAAFGTTSGAPMLHIEGITPESEKHDINELPGESIGLDKIRDAWLAFNQSHKTVDLIALGSPHLSVGECQKFAMCMAGRLVAKDVDVILTIGKDTLQRIETSGLLAQLNQLGAQVVSDVCWCSISKPLFPVNTQTLMTNSAKYAHYGPALSGCEVLFGSLSDCAHAAATGMPPRLPPTWLTE